MTVSTEVNQAAYTGNGVTTVFPYTFRILNASNLTVTRIDLQEVETVLTLGTDYTVTGAGSYNGGAVVLPQPLQSNYSLVIVRDLDIVQETDLRNQGTFFAEVHEDAFDYLTMIIQQVASWFGLALRRPTIKSNFYNALQYRISNLADPVNDQDAVNTRSMRSYVEKMIAGVVGGFGWFIQAGFGAIYRTFQDKMRDTVSIKDFGAKGDSLTDDAYAINLALAGGNKKVIFPDGNYLIKSYLRIYANTTIEMSKGCKILNDNQTAEFVFVNGELGNANYASGYDGDGNIVIQGGTIDNAIRASKGVATKGISIGHATNVTIRNVTFMNNFESHFIEINSTKGALIEGCRFYNLNPNSASTDGSRECINIDYASAAGFPEFGAYDNTVCDDVKVINCQFESGDVGVGSHGISPLGAHQRINISNNTFRNMQSVGIAAWCWSDSIVHGNKLINCGPRCIKVWACTTTTLSGNTVSGQGSVAQLTLDSNNGVTTNNIILTGNTFIGGTSHQIRAVICFNVLFSGNNFRDSTGSGIITSATASQLNIIANNFYNCGQTTPASCIRLGSPNCKISENNITGLAGSILYGTGIFLEDAATAANLSDNNITPGVTQSIRYPTASLKLGETHTFALAQDSVGIIAIETPRKQGMLLIGASNKEVGANGILFIRANSGEEDVTKISTLGTFATATTVLTGTTGASGQVTVSVNNGKLYIENRIVGGTSIFRMQMLTV